MLTWKEGYDDMLSNIIMMSVMIRSAKKDLTEDYVFGQMP